MRTHPISESGNVSLITLFSLVSLSLLAVLALSVGATYAKWVQLTTAVETAREATMTAGFQMRVKNASNPGVLVSNKLVEELRRAGIDDEVLVLFEESVDPALGANTRALAAVARVDLQFQVCALMGTISVPYTTSISIIPYAESQVYRPRGAPVGSVSAYAYARGSNVLGSGSATARKQDMNALSIALAQTVEKAKNL